MKSHLGLFKKGQIPWNKETKGIMKVNSGSFKKGNIPLDPIKKGEHRGLKTEFKKGQVGWNKGLTTKDDSRIASGCRSVKAWKRKRTMTFKKYGWQVIYFNELEVNEKKVLEVLS